MSADSEMRPSDDSWVVAVHSSEHNAHPSGSGLVIDRQRILTCAHVARRIQDSGREIWVAFPKSKKGPAPRSRVAREHVVFADSGAEVQDLAILHLSEPLPPGVDPVPLRDPASASLLSLRWWAFGFPQGHPAGNSARGTVGEVLASGLLRIDRKSRYGVESGFSGAGVWSPEYRAVVAVVTEAENRRGDGQAIPLHHLEACFPAGQITDLTGRWSAVEAGDVALSAWGWSLAGDPETERHWSPRARGVPSDSEHGYRFQGRTGALQVIKDWLDRDRDRAHRRMLVVTGAPGAGKSAVLGRIVTTADADAVRELPASDVAVRATVDSVACAVHAKGKSALEVATEIARAASAELPKDIEDFPRVLHAVLTRQGHRFNVIIDALDEVVSLSEARDIVRKVILPMTETFSDVDARVVVGSRQAGRTGDLLGRYRQSSRLVDLDDPEFYAEDDLVAYALATLQLAGDEQPENEEGEGRKPNPYADARVAGPVATRIAELSAGNFLVAGLMARTRGMADETLVSPEHLSFSPRISDAMDDYLALVPGVAGVEAGKLLRALAFAESPGLPVSLWGKAIQALGYGNVAEVRIARFTQTRAASFLIESSEEDGHGAVFRLFHQALNDALLNADEPGTARQAEEELLTCAFLSIGRDGGWERAPTYLLRSLPAHAARAGLVDELLADNAYLLHSDLRRVLQVADQAASRGARDRARLLGLTPEAVPADPPERAAMFSVTEAMDGIGAAYRAGRWPVPYCAQWSVTAPSRENLTLRGHQGWVNAVCAVRARDRTLLAVGGTGGVRLWDPVDGSHARVLEGGQGQVRDLCTVQVEGRTLLAGGADKTVRLWDPVDGSLVRVLDAHQGGVVVAVCEVQTRDRTLLATVGGYDGVVRLWDPVNGSQVRVLDVPQGWVNALCTVQVEGRTLLAAGSGNGLVRLWNPVDGSLVRVLEGPRDIAEAVCELRAGDRTLLAVGCGYGLVRLWDPVDGSLVRVLDADQGGVWAICAVQAAGRSLLAAAVGSDRTVRLWDPVDGSQARVLEGHQDIVKTMCELRAGDRTLLATAGDYERTVRLWDLSTASTDEEAQARESGVLAVCGVQAGDRILLAVGGIDGAVRMRDPMDGSQVRVLDAGHGGVWAVCEVRAGRRTLLATVGGYDSAVRLWDPVNGSQVRVLDVHQDYGVEVPRDIVKTVCAVQAGHRTLLATVSEIDSAVRLWDPVDGSEVRVLDDYLGGWRTVCGVQVGDRSLLAVGGYDGTVRLWDLPDGSEVLVLEAHQGEVVSVCVVQAGRRTLLATADSDDKTVRLWNPINGRCELTVPVHHAVSAMTSVAGSLMAGLATGVIAIKFGSAEQR